MTSMPPFTLTDESVTVIWEGTPHTFKKGTPNYNAIRRAIGDGNWEEISKHLTIPDSITNWSKGKFKAGADGTVTYDGETVPAGLSKRIINMAGNGDDPSPLLKFWERLQKNPSYRSVNQLWPFMEHEGIPLTMDGCFLAYKSVTRDYKDHHTGTIDNSPGTVHEMPRNKISDDPNTPCHYGFHVGALGYASGFGYGEKRVIICKVAPENVVCVPYDSSQQKMRVCKYAVIGNKGDVLPSTLFIEEGNEYKVKWRGGEELETDPEEEYDEPYTYPDYDDYEYEDEEDEEDLEEEEDLETGHTTDEDLFKSLDGMDSYELGKQSLSDLRKYAAQHLKIVGASKIPGGKITLISKILEVR